MTTVIRKNSTAERFRLQRLRVRTTGIIRRALDAFLSVTRSEQMTRQIADYLEDGDSNAALQAIESQINTLGNSIPRAFIDVATSEAESIAELLQRFFPRESHIGYSFDPSYERAARLMQRQKMEFIQDFSRGQMNHTRQVLSQALRDGEGPLGAARRIRDSIGLTLDQEQWVRNYEMNLRGGPRSSVYADTLNRDARDRRFDRTIERHRREGIPLSEEQISRMTQRYRERLLGYRADTIARTETQAVLGAARHEAQTQVHDEAGILDEWIRRAWLTSIDGRERSTHHDAHNQTIVGMHSKFIVGASLMLHPGDRSAAPEEIINCRCDEEISYEIPDGATLRG